MTQWRKSSYSGGQGECVEVATLPGGGHAVRDSKDSDGPRLVFPPTGWQAFTSQVKAGQHDLA